MYLNEPQNMECEFPKFWSPSREEFVRELLRYHSSILKKAQVIPYQPTILRKIIPMLIEVSDISSEEWNFIFNNPRVLTFIELVDILFTCNSFCTCTISYKFKKYPALSFVYENNVNSGFFDIKVMYSNL